MSLVILAADSTQALAVADGRIETVIPIKGMPRDDFRKVVELSPEVSLAATGWCSILLFQQVRAWAKSWQPGASLRGLFCDAATFAEDWASKQPFRDQIAAAIFGWDFRLQRMRVNVWNGSTMREGLPQKPGSPIEAVFGITDGVKLPLGLEMDPERKMREIVSSVSARNHSVGSKSFAYLLQAPQSFLGKPRAGRVWPTFDAEDFARKLRDDPPFDIDQVLRVKEGTF